MSDICRWESQSDEHVRKRAGGVEAMAEVPPQARVRLPRPLLPAVTAAGICLMLVSLSGAAAEKQAADASARHSCDRAGEGFEPVPLAELDGNVDDYIESVIAEVYSMLGLQNRIVVTQQAEFGNMAMTVDNDDNRVLAYDPSFLTELVHETGTAWAVVSALAHEVGHVLAGHSTVATGSLSQQELEADEFSGFIMCDLSASLQESQAAMRALGDIADPRWPALGERLAAIERGWRSSARVHGAR